MVITDSEDAVRLVSGGADKMIVVSKGRPISGRIPPASGDSDGMSEGHP
jgi:hypothetical protein